MHSQLALTEHVSLNLAPLILLDPVYSPVSCMPSILHLCCESNPYQGCQDLLDVVVVRNQLTLFCKNQTKQSQSGRELHGSDPYGHHMWTILLQQHHHHIRGAAATMMPSGDGGRDKSSKAS